MSDSSSGEKTEQPTSKKLRDLRNKGQVPKSKEVASVTMVAAFFLYLGISWEATSQRLQSLILLPAGLINKPFDEALKLGLETVTSEILSVIIPYLAIVIVIAPLAHFGQFGFLLSFESLTPQINRLDPVQGFKKIFALNNLIELIKSSTQTVLMVLIIAKILTDDISSFIATPYCDLSCLVGTTVEVLSKFAAYTLGVFIITAAADFGFQKFNFIKQNRMTKDDVKREHKSTEGDPLIKGQRKQIHHEMLNDDTIDQIKKATLMLRDGKRLSVVIRYQAGVTPLPIIVAMGKQGLAARIAGVAEGVNLPTVESALLAQALFTEGQVQNFVPRDYLQSVAKILSEETASLK